VIYIYTGSNDTSLQEVDYSVLTYIQLQVSCNTWTREHARANVGVECLEEKTEESSHFTCKGLDVDHPLPKVQSSLNVYEVLEIYKHSGEIIPDALQRLRGAYLSSAKYISDLNADSKF